MMISDWTIFKAFDKSFLRLVLCAACINLLAACTTNPATGKSQFTAFMSPQQEMQIGAGEHDKIQKQFGLYDDASLSSYVSGIGQRVTARTERPDVQYKFFVLDSPIVNAFALPGGYIYVSRGLVSLANNEAELAAVLAHEAGHITGRHSAERYSHGVVTSLGAGLLSAAVDSNSVSQALGLGSNLYLSSYSRGQESEADSLGLRYMAQGGYDVSAMPAFLSSLERYSSFEALKDGRKQSGYSYFSTHPATGDRVSNTRAQGGAYGQGGALGRDNHMNQIQSMVFGDNATQGFAKGQSFYHPKLKFTFQTPDGYSVINQPDQVVIKRTNGGIALFDLAASQTGLSPQAYLQNVWMKNEKLQGIENLNINGAPAATAAFDGRVNGNPVTIRLVVIAWKPNQVARFQIAIPRGTSSAELNELKRMTHSFRAMNTQEINSIKPYRISVKTVQNQNQLNSLIQAQPIEKYKQEQFLALNGLNSLSAARSGERYKFITE